MTQRVGAIALLLAGLVTIEVFADRWFLLFISAGLIAGPLLAWAAFSKLRGKHRADPSIRSLRAAMFVALYAAAIATILASIAFFVVGRELGLWPAIDRQTFIVLLAWALLILPLLAVEWLTLRVWPTAEAPE